MHIEELAVRRSHDTAVILHLFYPEMWDEIHSYLSNLGRDFDLFVTIPQGTDIRESTILSVFPDAQVHWCENRGRDIAPFLRILSSVSKLDYKYICKIHSKKSPHLPDGQRWRQDMLSKLLGSPDVVARIKGAFDDHSDWGLVAPRGHVVPHVYFWNRNSRNTLSLAHTLGIHTDPVDFSFVAGSMFWFRPRALELLTRASASAAVFERERGQQDGAMTHAFERLFGMVPNHCGYKIAECDSSGVWPADSSYQFTLLARTLDAQSNSPEDALKARAADDFDEASIQALRDGHRGETAWIVGKGPSLVMLSKAHIGEGPVIALNEAIIAVEALGLPNPTYSMQKDAEGYDAAPETAAGWVPRLGATSPIAPLQKAALLVHRHESSTRMEEYRPRYVFDNIKDFGLEWWEFSTVVAIAAARLMGCSKVVFVCLDATTHGDARTCIPRSSGSFEILTDDPGGAEYAQHRLRIDDYLTSASLSAEYLTPETSSRQRSHQRMLISALNDDLERLGTEVELGSRERDRLMGVVETCHQDIQRLTTEINDLSSRVEERSRDVGRLTSELTEKRVEAAAATALAEERALATERLTSELAEAQRYARALLSSRSWRWTAPIRAAKRILTRPS